MKIHTVFRIGRDGRKRFPVAIKSFSNSTDAETLKERMMKEENIKEDDIWVECSFAKKLVDNPIRGFDVDSCEDNEVLAGTLYHVWLYEDKRRVLGIVDKTFTSAEDMERYKAKELTKESLREYWGGVITGYEICECEFVN